MKPELYIEEIAARAGLDGARRDYYVPKLHEQLDKITRDAEASGVSREEAEAAAMRVMGTPEAVARGLGARTKFVWVVLEAVAMGVVAYFFACMTIGRAFRSQGLTSRHIILTAALVAIVYAIFRIWKRYWVDTENTYSIRPFRPRLTVPFESITSVQMERGRLFGAHRIQVYYGVRNRLTLDSTVPNFRFVAAALREYAPEKLDAKVTHYLEQQKLMPSRMATWKAVVLTVGWFVAAGLMLFMVNVTWENLGILYTFAGGILLAAVVATTGIAFACERVQRLLFAILTAGFIWLLQLCVALLMLDISFRVVLWLALAALPLGVLITWWSSRRSWLQFGTGIVWLAAIFGASYLLPPGIHSTTQSLGTSSFIVESSLWMNPDTVGNEPVIFSHGLSYGKGKDKASKSRNAYAVFRGNADALGDELPVGEWHLVDRLTTGTVLLVHSMNDRSSTPSLAQFYVINMDGNLKPDVAVEGISPTVLDLVQSYAIVSPNKRYIVTARKDVSLVIVDRDAKTTKSFSQFSANEAWKWEDNHTLALLQRETIKANEKPDGKITKWLLDVATGSTTQTGILNLGAGWNLYGGPSAEYSLLQNDNGFGIVNLLDGTSTTLPLADENCPAHWDADLNRVSYISQSEQDKEVIVAGPDGVIARHKVDSRRKYAWAKLSPDASKVFLVSQIENYRLMLPVGKLEIWDIASDQLITIGQEPSVYSVLVFLSHSNRMSRLDSVVWSPDSKSIAWPSGYFIQDSNQAGMEMELITPEN